MREPEEVAPSCSLLPRPVVAGPARRFWLHRRSSKNAMPWARFEALLERMPLPQPKIIHAV